MIFSWLKRRRRRKRRGLPFPSAWVDYLEANVPQYRTLPTPLVDKLHGDIRVFIAEKSWEGCGGLELDDEIRVTIAANACLLLLGAARPHHYFDTVLSVLVYPTSFHGSFDGETMGEAWQHGPVILSWDEIVENRGTDRNVVVHEFAHQLDGLDGEMEGAPPLSREQHRRWTEIAEREYHRLVARADRDEPTLLDHYGAENRAEFFAVVSECFFERPHELAIEHPDLFEWLTVFYRQDPRAWATERPSAAGDEPNADEATPADVDGAQFDLEDPHDSAFARAVVLESSGDYATALTLYDRLAAAASDDAELATRRAAVLIELDRDDEAIESANRAVALDGSWLEARRTRARVLVLSDRAGDALPDLDYVLAREFDAECSIYRGAAYNDAGRHRDAIADLDAAIRDRPDSAEAYLERAQAWEALGDDARAAADRAEAHALDPALADDG